MALLLIYELESLAIVHPEIFFPLPWREGIKGRGITPTLILPRHEGGTYGFFG